MHHTMRLLASLAVITLLFVVCTDNRKPTAVTGSSSAPSNETTTTSAP